TFQFDQRLPRLDIFAAAGQRPMDEEEVDLSDAEPLHGFVEAFQGKVARVPAIAEFRRDEQFAARHAGRGDRSANALFVVVALGGVDQAVAGLDAVRNHARSDPGVDLPDAETELRDGRAVAEFCFWIRRHGWKNLGYNELKSIRVTTSVVIAVRVRRPPPVLPL